MRVSSASKMAFSTYTERCTPVGRTQASTSNIFEFASMEKSGGAASAPAWAVGLAMLVYQGYYGCQVSQTGWPPREELRTRLAARAGVSDPASRAQERSIGVESDDHRARPCAGARSLPHPGPRSARVAHARWADCVHGPRIHGTKALPAGCGRALPDPAAPRTG